MAGELVEPFNISKNKNDAKDKEEEEEEEEEIDEIDMLLDEVAERKEFMDELESLGQLTKPIRQKIHTEISQVNVYFLTLRESSVIKSIGHANLISIPFQYHRELPV